MKFANNMQGTKLTLIQIYDSINLVIHKSIVINDESKVKKEKEADLCYYYQEKISKRYFR